MSRRGKIARLPKPLVLAVNRALERGEDAATILRWLNRAPQARKVFAKWFGGRPVNEQNLSQWRLGGYPQWLRHQEACAIVNRVMEKAGALEDVAGADAPPIGERLSTVLVAELIGVAELLLKEASTTEQRWDRLERVFAVVNRIRQADTRTGKLSLERMKTELRAMEKEPVLGRQQTLQRVTDLMLEENARRALAGSLDYATCGKGIIDACFSQDQEEEGKGGRRHGRAGKRRQRSGKEEDSEETEEREEEMEETEETEELEGNRDGIPTNAVEVIAEVEAEARAKAAEAGKNDDSAEPMVIPEEAESVNAKPAPAPDGVQSAAAGVAVGEAKSEPAVAEASAAVPAGPEPAVSATADEAKTTPINANQDKKETVESPAKAPEPAAGTAVGAAPEPAVAVESTPPPMTYRERIEATFRVQPKPPPAPVVTPVENPAAGESRPMTYRERIEATFRWPAKPQEVLPPASDDYRKRIEDTFKAPPRPPEVEQPMDPSLAAAIMVERDRAERRRLYLLGPRPDLPDVPWRPNW